MFIENDLENFKEADDLMTACRSKLLDLEEQLNEQGREAYLLGAKYIQHLLREYPRLEQGNLCYTRYGAALYRADGTGINFSELDEPEDSPKHFPTSFWSRYAHLVHWFNGVKPKFPRARFLVLVTRSSIDFIDADKPKGLQGVTDITPDPGSDSESHAIAPELDSGGGGSESPGSGLLDPGSGG